MALRGLVSKKKIRFKKDGFDLDLTYIRPPNVPDPRIIALGFPSEGAEAAYRNPMDQVQKFFDTYHKGNFRIYNLCSERAYDFDKFGGPDFARRYPFDDHNPAPLQLIWAMCEDMYEYLQGDENRYAAIHCKAGKGRTGMIISAYLVRAGIAKNTMEGLKMFGVSRTSNGKGVTIPSQMRYVHYYEHCLRIGRIPRPLAYRIKHVRLITIPNLDVVGGCDPYFDCRVARMKDPDDASQGLTMTKVYDYKKENKGKVANFRPRHKYADLQLEGLRPLSVQGDVKLVFWDYDKFGGDDKAFHFWFNTAFVYNNYLLLHKEVLDRACKDNDHFDPDFKVEVFFEQVDAEEAAATIGAGEEVDDDKEDGMLEGEEGAAAGGGGADD